MTTRREFLRGAAVLVTGAAALEAYERLTWTQKFWSGWRFPKRWEVRTDGEFEQAINGAWRGDTIFVHPDHGVVLDLKIPYPYQPKGYGKPVLITSGVVLSEGECRTKLDAYAETCLPRHRINWGVVGTKTSHDYRVIS